jgi:putative ATP-binding cassette transporter
MRRIFGQIWRLMRLCAAGRRGRIGAAYFLIVFCLDLAAIQVTLRLISWTADFYNALQKVAIEEAIRQIGVFFLIISLSAALSLVSTYIRRLLQMRWRQNLTEAALERWLRDKTYWLLWLKARGEEIDNPDQRIADDCRIFVNRLTEEALELISKMVGVASYFALLWSLSTFPLAFPLFGWDVEIPRYMVWAAPLYVLIASGMTHFLGAPLHKLNVEQQHREADFRFALARMRESVDPIALSGGEPAERRIFDRRFQAIIENWRRLIRRDFILGCFTRPYMQTVLRIPLFLALPAFLAGKVTLGGLMQIGSAFQNVVTTLSWFVFSYRDLVELAAATARLDRFLAAMEAASATPREILRTSSDDGGLSTRGLILRTPGSHELLRIPDLAIEPGAAIWIRGRSGLGKSTLLRALAGLWPYGEGTVRLPLDERMTILPQQSYAPLDTIAAAAAYPLPPDAVDHDIIRRALADVGLGDIASNDPEAVKRLSGGERQRLAMARLLIHESRLIVLDEATSALDPEAEQRIMTMLRKRSPQAMFVIVAHREPVGCGPLTCVDLDCGAPAAIARPLERPALEQI